MPTESSSLATRNLCQSRCPESLSVSLPGISATFATQKSQG
jgi:hypothetical protein